MEHVKVIHAASKGFSPSRLRVRHRAWLLVAASLIALLLVFWILVEEIARQGRSVFSVAALGVVVLSVCVWLFARLYFLSSIVLDQHGVRQLHLLHLLHCARSMGEIDLSWDRVQQVSFDRASYVFVGDDGSKAVLDTRLFRNPVAVSLSVRLHLPKRLLTQMDLP